MNDESHDAEGQRAGGAPRRDGALLAPLRIGSRRGDRPHTALTSARRIGCHSSCRNLRPPAIPRFSRLPSGTGTVLLSSRTIADQRSARMTARGLGSITCHIDLLLDVLCLQRYVRAIRRSFLAPEVSIDHRRI